MTNIKNIKGVSTETLKILKEQYKNNENYSALIEERYKFCKKQIRKAQETEGTELIKILQVFHENP